MTGIRLCRVIMGPILLTVALSLVIMTAVREAFVESLAAQIAMLAVDAAIFFWAGRLVAQSGVTSKSAAFASGVIVFAMTSTVSGLYWLLHDPMAAAGVALAFLLFFWIPGLVALAGARFVLDA